MKKFAWILAVVMMSVLVCSSLALAQEKATAARKAEKSEKQIVIKLPEGAGQTMPGCQMMGQMGPMWQMGQSPACTMMRPMAGRGAGRMQGGMGCCAMAGRGAGMGPMGAGTGMGCGMMCGPAGQGMSGGMCRHGCAGCYLNCADALELSQKQVGELKAMCSAARKAMIRKQADIKVAQAELNEIMSEEVLDFAKAKAKINEISGLKAGIQTERLSNIQKAQKVLTADQLKQCKAMCGAAGQQVRKCITIMKGAGGMEMGDDAEDVEIEVEEEDN